MIELMVTVAISSILIAVAAPSMTSAYQQYTVTGQANELVNALGYARSEAIRRNMPIVFCRTSSELATSCATTAGDWKYWLILANNTIINRGFIKSQASLKQTSPLQSFTFGADGMAYNNQQLLNATYIQLKAGSQVRCINLQAGNRTHVSKPDDAEDDDEHTGGSCA